MFIIWICLLFFMKQVNGGYIETVSISGCESCRLYLTCRELTSIIAILEANFDSNKAISTETATAFPPTFPRSCLNYRCSGVNHCSFILKKDCPGAENWGRGILHIKYACITEDKVTKFCNSEISLRDASGNRGGKSEGFIRNPGYPRFYGGQTPCRWRIVAPDQQKLQLTILDLSVVVDNPKYPNYCTEDGLDIIDSDIIIWSTCQQLDPPPKIISISDTVEIILHGTKTLTPQRGFLLHYTTVGCPDPQIPNNGYLISANDTYVEFLCCVGYVFPDTRERKRAVRCYGSNWGEKFPLPDCQKFEIYIDKKVKPVVTQMASELLTPAILILMLFLINGIVLFYIHKAKQRNAIKIKDEEIGALTLTERELPAIIS